MRAWVIADDGVECHERGYVVFKSKPIFSIKIDIKNGDFIGLIFQRDWDKKYIVHADVLDELIESGRIKRYRKHGVKYEDNK